MISEVIMVMSLIISDIDIHIDNLRGGMMVMSLIIFDIVHQSHFICQLIPMIWHSLYFAGTW